MRTYLLSSLALVATLSLVGCGSDDGGENTTTEDTGAATSETGTDTGSSTTDTGSSTTDTGTSTEETGGDTGTAMETGGDTGGDASAAPTFAKIYNEILRAKCGGCHTTSTAGNLDMKNKDTAYGELMKKAEGVCASTMKNRVTPNNVGESLLIDKLKKADSEVCGDRMPEGRPALSALETKMIEDWINAGALNNN